MMPHRCLSKQLSLNGSNSDVIFILKESGEFAAAVAVYMHKI